MTFVQQYTVKEQGFGTRTIRIMLSDTYEHLYKPDSFFSSDPNDGLVIDIVDIDQTNKALNTDTGSFKAQNLKFAISTASFESGSDDENAFWFTVDAKDFFTTRYIAVFIDPDWTTDDTLLATIDFVGKIQSAISQDDEAWDGGEYDTDINPVSNYGFMALSFDIGLLKEVKLNELMSNPDPDSVDKIAPVFGYWIDSEYVQGRIRQTDAEQIFKHRLHHKSWKDGSEGGIAMEAADPKMKYIFTPPQASIKQALNLILDKSADVLEDLFGIRTLFQIADSSLGFKTQAMRHTYKTKARTVSKSSGEKYNWETLWESSRSVGGISVWIGDEGIETRTKSAAYVDIFNFDPMLFTDPEERALVVIRSSELKHSWRTCDTALELLSKLAHAFGCYLIFGYGIESFTITFASRAQIVEDNEEVFVIDVTEASNQSSTRGADSKVELSISQANAYAAGGVDSFVIGKTSGVPYVIPEVSDKLKEDIEARALDMQLRDVEYKQLLMSAAPTIQQVRLGFKDYRYDFPLNTVYFRRNTIESEYTDGYEVDFRNWQTGILARSYIMQHSSIYVRFPWYVPGQTDGADFDWWGAEVNDLFLQAPASGIIITVAGEEIYFKTTAEFVDYLQNADKKAYESEYDLTVPFWSGFGDDASGANAKWNKVKIGSKIRLKIAVKTYSGGTFTSATQDLYYIVVDLTRGYENIETKLKLHYVGRFDYSEPSTVGESKQDSSQSQAEEVTEEAVEGTVRGYQVEDEVFILNGDSVMIMSTGNIKKSDGQEGTHGKTFGIALESGYGKDYDIEGTPNPTPDVIEVQIDGKVLMPTIYDFTNIGQPLYARLTAQEQVNNISESPLTARTTSEQNRIELGRIDGSQGFILNIHERILEA